MRTDAETCLVYVVCCGCDCCWRAGSIGISGREFSVERGSYRQRRTISPLCCRECRSSSLRSVCRWRDGCGWRRCSSLWLLLLWMRCRGLCGLLRLQRCWCSLLCLHRHAANVVNTKKEFAVAARRGTDTNWDSHVATRVRFDGSAEGARVHSRSRHPHRARRARRRLQPRLPGGLSFSRLAHSVGRCD